MDNKNWQKLETIFHSALELDGAARDEFLRRACGGNQNLISEVESLISAIDDEPDFMNEPAFNLGLQAMEARDTKSLTGERVGDYVIGEKLGAGGMGEVYAADDLRLNRRVALKFLSGSFGGDEIAGKRLTREARAVAKLDHPNVCPIYGLEKTDDLQFIVMQHIEGETLSQLIKQNRLAPDEVLPIARQVADALAAAHAAGVVHRDVKPSNIMLTPEGLVKVLDFGLAKITDDGRGPARDESFLSQKGLILGTIAYMSPEQLKGEAIDFRSDVFSFGILLAELFQAKNPFARESDAETISAILRGEVAFAPRADSRFPAGAQKIVRKCLELDKEKRYASAEEILGDLQRMHKFGRFDYQKLIVRAALAVSLLLLVLASGVLLQKALRVRTLAVLPFAHQTADAEYLGNGMAEDLINRFSGTNKLRVKNFAAVSGYRSEAADPVEAGRRLNVDAVLTGSISRQSDDGLVLRTNLIDTTDGTVIWKVDKPLRETELLKLQAEIADAIVRKLEPWSSYFLPARARAEKRTDNPEAFDLYLKGRYYWQKRDKDNLARAIGYFQRAIDLDPSYAKAYAGLADCYVQQSQVAYGDVTGREAMAKAKAAARQAVEIDDLSSESHTSFGNVLFKFDWNWTEAEAAFRRALAIDPENATAHYFYSNMLSVTGRADEAMTEGLKARELDPFSQITKIHIARIHYNAGRYAEALEVMNAKDENTIESNLKTRYMLGLIYIKKGMYAEATEIYESLYAVDRSFGAAPLGYCYARTNRAPRALELIAEREASGEYFPPTEKAVIYAGLGDKPKALAALREAVDGKYSAIIAIKVEPLYEELRDEPEFRELLKKMNLD